MKTEMSIGLVTLNARYIHSALSLRYLRNAATLAGHRNVWIREFTISDPVWKIAAEINKQKPDVVGISVYIWNRIQSLQLAEILIKQNPGLRLVLGGPEVSFEKPGSLDHIVVSGEGEKKWVEALEFFSKNETPPADALQRWGRYGEDLPDLTVPYREEDYPNLKNRFAYFETSRGCPYHCSFCLSALDKTVRYFDEDAAKEQIERLVDSGVRAVKFVDRTFNLKPQRVMRLLRWLAGLEKCSFHFEVVGDILSEEVLTFLDDAPRGKFQFEIGIQTATEEIQTNIQRQQNNERLFKIIRRLTEKNRVHIHADLIFGLPGETRDQILNSFRRVLALEPDELQLGFLKFLPGAPINKVADDFAYAFQTFPPYEMISNKDLSAGELIRLKYFAQVFGLFYNSKRFQFSLRRLLKSADPVELFERLLNHLEEKNQLNTPLSLEAQYRVFGEAFSLLENDSGRDVLKLDYLYHQRVFHLPEFFQPEGKKAGNLKSWSVDRKTPRVPFLHEIRLTGRDVEMLPSDETVFYAVAHPANSEGYFVEPTIHRD